MIDPSAAAALATTAMTVIVPYLTAGAGKVADGVAEEVGKRALGFALDTARRVWDRVRKAFDGHGSQAVVEEFAQQPSDGVRMMKNVLARRLEGDPDLAHELTELLDRRDPDTHETASQILMNAGGDAILLDLRNADFSGSRNVTIVGKSVDMRPSPKPALPDLRDHD
ncbi:MAG TPA: hypothetical protein VNV25_09150 [Gemmatimonadaceae bacterium]|jgi:hypothetical protein|nr:hypothetical protein [Gemmatimonadaceae bacterium]